MDGLLGVVPQGVPACGSARGPEGLDPLALGAEGAQLPPPAVPSWGAAPPPGTSEALAPPAPADVGHLGTDVLRGFRLKAFALLVLQCTLTLALAIGVDLASDGGAALGPLGFAALATTTALALLGVALVRHRYPWNYAGELLFTLLAAATLGLMSKQLLDLQDHCAPDLPRVRAAQFYALGLYDLGLALTTPLALIRFGAGRDRMMTCFLCSILAAAVSSALGVGAWALMPICPVSWLVSVLALSSVSLMWTGLQNDRLARRLNPDEYLLPLILVWAELIAGIVVVVVGCFLCAAGAEVTCLEPMAYGSYGCDCFFLGRRRGDQVWPTDREDGAGGNARIAKQMGLPVP